MQEALNDLKRCVKQYREVDDELQELNKKVYEKRESRKIVEMEMADLIKLPEFENIDKLKIDDDGSTIKIKRPSTYSKAWSLSKSDLISLVTDYFNSNGMHTAEDCIKYVIAEQQKKLVSKDFNFTRIISED